MHYTNNNGNRGLSTSSFDHWKLPGDGKRESTVYASTRPILAEEGVDLSSPPSSRGGLHPWLTIDPSLNEPDAMRVRQFLKEAKSGETPLEFFSRRARVAPNNVGVDESMTSDEKIKDEQKKVLCDSTSGADQRWATGGGEGLSSDSRCKSLSFILNVRIYPAYLTLFAMIVPSLRPSFWP